MDNEQVKSWYDVCLDCSCQGSMSDPPSHWSFQAQFRTTYIYIVRLGFKCAHGKAECTGWSLASVLGCSFTLLLLLPPLHCLQHCHLLGLLLLVPGFKLQPEDVRNGTIKPEIKKKKMHLRMIRRNTSSPSPVFNNPLDDIIGGEVIPAVDGPEYSPLLRLLRTEHTASC